MSNLQKLLNYLFVSKVRIKSLKYFFSHEDTPIHLRAVSRILNEEINAVRRELMRLVEIKLLKSEKRGNKKYFILNKGFPFFEELLNIVIKSEGIAEDILKNQSKLGPVHFAGLTNSFVSGIKSSHKEIDLVIIGDVDLTLVSEIIQKEEERLEREINYTVLRLSEFNLRKKRRDVFIINLLLSTRILVIGDREEYNS
jgi:hypothetical protein